MSQNLWTAFISANGSNQILVDSTPDGKKWTGSRFINQWSPHTPAIAYLAPRLYIAFITNDVAISGSSATPSNRIFITSTDDGVSWSAATYSNQHSKCAPALAAWNGTLYLAFVANDSTNRILVCTSEDGTHWTGNTQTGQASPQPPALAAFGDNLQMMFVSNDSRNALLRCGYTPSQGWSGAIDTGQSCRFSPSITEYGGLIYAGFVANSDSQTVLVASSANWSANTSVRQTSAAAPSLVAFGDDLNVSFIAKDSTVECLLSASATPTQASSWPAVSGDIEQQSNSAAALAVAPFACCASMVAPTPYVPPNGGLQGGSNYFLWSGSCSPASNLTGLVLTIEITSDLFSTNGFSFQWNCWSPTGANINCVWQQYGFGIDPQGNINVFMENWESRSFTEIDNDTLNGNICNYRRFFYKLPTPTVTAGYVLTIELLYAGNTIPGAAPDCVSGAIFTLANQGTQVATTGPIQLTQVPIDTKAPPPTPTVSAAALVPVAGYEIMMVGIYTSPSDPTAYLANFTSGQGSFTITSNTPMQPTTATARNTLPCITKQGGTNEKGNSAYAALPSCPSKTIVQPFSVTT